MNNQTDPKRYGQVIDEYVESIYDRRLSPAALHDGMNVIRDTWKFVRWPTIGELLDILKPPEYVGTATVLSKPKPEPWAEKIMALPEGQTALKEGFARELWLWAGANPGQIPSQTVLSECKAEDDKFRITLRATIDRVKKSDTSNKTGNLANAVVLNAAGRMEGFETLLRKKFLAAA